jgi:putative ABC transport system permease protein
MKLFKGKPEQSITELAEPPVSRREINKPTYNQIEAMFKNNLKIAFRYLAKHKGYTLINIVGLAVGIAAVILIMLFVRSEWSFDSMHSNADRIHRAWLEEHYQGEIFTNVVTPIPLGPLLENSLPEVETVARVTGINAPIKHEGNTFNYPVTMVDNAFFEVFDFELIKGDNENPFPDKNSIILTEDAAANLFGDPAPMGETLELEVGGESMLFTISGITENVPYESSIQYEFLIPFSNAVHIWSESTRTSAWSNVSVETFVLLKLIPKFLLLWILWWQIIINPGNIPSPFNPYLTFILEQPCPKL